MLSGTFFAWTADDDALLLERKTYDIFYAYWPTTGDHPVNKRLDTIGKYVASRSVKSADWVTTTALNGRRIRQAPVHGRRDPGRLP